MRRNAMPRAETWCLYVLENYQGPGQAPKHDQTGPKTNGQWPTNMHEHLALKHWPARKLFWQKRPSTRVKYWWLSHPLKDVSCYGLSSLAGMKTNSIWTHGAASQFQQLFIELGIEEQLVSLLILWKDLCARRLCCHMVRPACTSWHKENPSSNSPCWSAAEM